MKILMATIAGTVLLGSPLIGQEAPPNAPKFVKFVKAPGLDVRFLDFRWDEEAFATIEKGGTHPAGQRSWVLARLLIPEVPLRWKDKTIPVGPSLLVLNPAKKGVGPTLELREVDMRDVFVDMNVIAEPPAGRTYQKVPALFGRAATMALLLEVTLQDKAGSLDLTVHYGDRLTTITLTR